MVGLSVDITSRHLVAQWVPNLANSCVRSCEVKTFRKVILELEIGIKANLMRDVP
jgi:hypothetical protein